MKLTNFLILIAVFLSCASEGKPSNKEARIGLLIVDEFDSPIEAVEVELGFRSVDAEGNLHFDKAFYHSDENGVVLAEVAYLDLLAAGLKKKGYYRHVVQTFANDDTLEGMDGEFDMVSRIVMKSVVSPIKMGVTPTSVYRLPNRGENFGFDLEVSDLVSPHGKGRVSDLIIRVSRSSGVEELEIFFPNEGDGFSIQSYPMNEGSVLKSSSRVEVSSFENSFSMKHGYHLNENGEKRRFDDYNANEVYIFRVRTKFNDSGEVVSCNYGKIYGGFRFNALHSPATVKFGTIYYNPLNNDDRLEYLLEENQILNAHHGYLIRP